MADLAQVKQLLLEALPGADVDIADLGGGDHLSVKVAAPQFAGKTLIDQHQMIYAPLKHLMADQTIHALQIKTTAKG